MTKVYRDAVGKAIHIGEWDYCFEIDSKGKKTARNPLPDGCVEAEENIVTGWDGGKYLHDDRRQYAPGDARRNG